MIYVTSPDHGAPSRVALTTMVPVAAVGVREETELPFVGASNAAASTGVWVQPARERVKRITHRIITYFRKIILPRFYIR